LNFREGSLSGMRIQENWKLDEMCFQNLDLSTYKSITMEKKWRHKEYWQLSIPCDVNEGLGLQYDSKKQLS